MRPQFLARKRESHHCNDAKGVQEKKKKVQVKPQSHVTKQSHKRDLHGHGKESVLTKKNTKQLIKYWLSPPTLGKI